MFAFGGGEELASWPPLPQAVMKALTAKMISMAIMDFGFIRIAYPSLDMKWSALAGGTMIKRIVPAIGVYPIIL
ncbi:hypothetical protein VQ056_04415 [Paenibacillus sp. JTLBN-2024]